MSRNIVEAVIFDVDGTLLDTERLASMSIKQVLAKFGKDEEYDWYYKCFENHMNTTRMSSAQQIFLFLKVFSGRYNAYYSLSAFTCPLWFIAGL